MARRRSRGKRDKGGVVRYRDKLGRFVSPGKVYIPEETRYYVVKDKKGVVRGYRDRYQRKVVKKREYLKKVDARTYIRWRFVSEGRVTEYSPDSTFIQNSLARDGIRSLEYMVEASGLNTSEVRRFIEDYQGREFSGGVKYFSYEKIPDPDSAKGWYKGYRPRYIPDTRVSLSWRNLKDRKKILKLAGM